MSNITLATFEQAVARKLGLYHAFKVTTEGGNNFDNFMATECKRYSNNVLWNKWVRVVRDVAFDRQIKANGQERGEIFFYEPYTQKIVVDDTAEITNYSMADIDRCINEAIEMCFPELNTPVQDKTLEVSSTSMYHLVPSNIRIIQRVEIGGDITETNDSTWIRCDWEEHWISGVKYISVDSFASGCKIRISGLATYGEYTTPASVLDFPIEWKRVITYGAVYNILTQYINMSGNDSKELAAIANLFVKEHNNLKAKFVMVPFATQTADSSFRMNYEG